VTAIPATVPATRRSGLGRPYAIRIQCWPMTTFKRVMKELHKEKGRIESELGRINQALNALQRLGKREVKKVRKLSAAARRRIAAAQRLRWAKFKAKS
jgi:Skp family chaperone for outer membrane proteins